jgi:hypothetical protein
MQRSKCAARIVYPATIYSIDGGRSNDDDALIAVLRRVSYLVLNFDGAIRLWYDPRYERGNDLISSHAGQILQQRKTDS